MMRRVRRPGCGEPWTLCPPSCSPLGSRTAFRPFTTANRGGARSAALEGAPRKIRVNAVLSGAIDTPMRWENPNVKAGGEKIDHSEVGRPEDVAEVIAFLASPPSAFVQGAAVRVDGGRLSRF